MGFYKTGLWLFPGVLEGLGSWELREAGRKYFHLSWYLLVPGITSYGQKPWGGFFFLPSTVSPGKHIW